MDDNAPLPPLLQGELDAAGIATWFAELASHAHVHELRAKGGAVEYSQGIAGLEALAAAWQGGALRAVQVRYTYDGEIWCDTALALPSGAARIVRVREVDIAPPA
jgi:hypothetical protein